MRYTRFVTDSPINESCVEIFCSYSHKEKDKALKEEFATVMRPYVRNQLIQLWTDSRIEAGNEWSVDINRHLASADIIVFLVSPDFLNSDYCCVKELNIALERKRRKEAILVPIIVRECAWEETALAALQALPADAKPVTKWDDRDSAWKNVADALKKLATGVLSRKAERVSAQGVEFKRPSLTEPGADRSEQSVAAILRDRKLAFEKMIALMGSVDPARVSAPDEAGSRPSAQKKSASGAFNDLDKYIRD